MIFLRLSCIFLKLAFITNKIVQEGYLVYECNERCSCSRTCPNRVLQNGVQVKLEVFMTETKAISSLCAILFIFANFFSFFFPFDKKHRAFITFI